MDNYNGISEFRFFMKILLFTWAFLLFGAGSVPAQEKETGRKFSGNNLIDKSKKRAADMSAEAQESAAERWGNITDLYDPPGKSTRRKPPFELAAAETPAEKKSVPETDKMDEPGVKAPDESPEKERFHWKSALIQTGLVLAVQHGVRFMQPKTRKQLAGPFFLDWGKSVRNLRGWRDGDSFSTNYLGHPLQGSATGRIFVNNSDRAKKQEFGNSKNYWVSRLKALAWTAVWSAQFELGPVSEANIGNVGLVPVGKYSSMAYVDLVITPVVGTGVLIGEDAIDKYILKNWLEKRGGGRTRIKILRTFLTPTTSFTNLLRGKAPWKRDTRPL
jgi:hypothetical protein